MAIINYIPNVKTATGFDTLNTVSQFTNHVATGVFTNGDTYEINVPAPNDILTGQFVLIFVPDSDSIVGMKISINNGTAIPVDGVGAGSLQNGVATSLLVDVGGGVAYPYFKNVDLTANNLPLTTGTSNLYGLSGADANVDKALATISNIKKVVSLRNTNVVSGVGVLLSFNQIDQNIGFDVNLSTQPTRLTIPLGVNKILLCGTFVCDNGTGAGGRGELHVRKNGVDSNEFPIIYGSPAISTSDVIQFSSSFSKVMAVNPGDYFQIYGYFNASKNFNFKANCSLSAINLI